jgi:hypothetical protein
MLTAWLQVCAHFEEVPLLRTEMGSLGDINAIVVDFQRASLTMLKARVTFAETIVRYPPMEHYLSTDYTLLRFRAFESGLLKLKKWMQLTLLGSNAARVFLKPETAADIAAAAAEDGAPDLRTIIERARDCIKKARLADPEDSELLSTPTTCRLHRT